MFFSKKKEETPLNSKEYEYLLLKIAELRSEVGDLKTNYRIIETNMDDLRGKFNRKLYQMAPKEEENKDKMPQSLNSFNPFK